MEGLIEEALSKHRDTKEYNEELADASQEATLSGFELCKAAVLHFHPSFSFSGMETAQEAYSLVCSKEVAASPDCTGELSMPTSPMLSPLGSAGALVRDEVPGSTDGGVATEKADEPQPVAKEILNSEKESGSLLERVEGEAAVKDA